MPIRYQGDIAVLSDLVGVEDAEALLEWLQGRSGLSVDLSTCTHLHAADLQVLMAAKPDISAWPDDVAFASWLETALRAPPTAR